MTAHKTQRRCFDFEHILFIISPEPCPQPMELNPETKPNTPETKSNWDSSGLGRYFAALVLILIASVALIDQSYFIIPEWLITWKVLLIAIGFYRILERRSADLPGMILIAVGGYFLARHIDPVLVSNVELWPFILIAIAIYLVLGKKPRFAKGERYKARKAWKTEYDQTYNAIVTPTSGPQPASSTGYAGNSGTSYSGNTTFGYDQSTDNIPGERLEMNLLFAGNKKKIVSPIFRGGQVNCLWGGAEIDLYETNIEGKVYLEVNVIMGGLQLRVPSGWQVSCDQTAILGGVEDNRRPMPMQEGPAKTLVITGLVLMGGVEISN
jgi:hypothetical protein